MCVCGRVCVDGVCVWTVWAVSDTHLRAHETGRNVVCGVLREKKKWGEVVVGVVGDGGGGVQDVQSVWVGCV